MIADILVAGIAIGAVYAMIGLAYNVMYSTSKVMSFTAGMLGMLGSVFGAYFITVLGWPVLLGLPAALLVGAAFGLLTERLAVRPVLRSIDKHLYVLSTLAMALMLQQVVAIWWGTEPRPFPTLLGIGQGRWSEEYWLPVVACLVTVAALEWFYHHTLTGRAFLAISEDAGAARALGIPERRMRVLSYMLSGVVGAFAGFVGGELLLAFFANGMNLTFYGFIPIAIGGLGSNRGALVGGLALGILQQVANYLFGGNWVSVVAFVVFIAILLIMPRGLFGAAEPRRV
jgi:branched-chain amino acid transport system permease protein